MRGGAPCARSKDVVDSGETRQLGAVLTWEGNAAPLAEWVHGSIPCLGKQQGGLAR